MDTRRIAIGLLLCAGWLNAQTSTATLQGQIQDATGAAVPKARLRLLNTANGTAREGASDESGRYVLPLLLPGDYSLTVEQAGFRRYTQANIKLDVQQILTLNIPLELGDVATAVEVSAAPPMLSTADSTVKTAISNKSITDLPLNGRLVLNLAATVPGVFTGVSSASSQNDNYTPMIGGGRMGTSETMVDGAPLSVADPTGGARVMGGLPPSPDAVEEFAVQINGLAAEYGRLGGGVINIATKQGTNALHGTARFFYRNSKLDANNFFANRNGVPLRSFKRNQYGFSAGGPVILPKIYDGRNRTFFFVDNETTNERTPANRTDTLPIDAWRQGDFSGLLNFRGAPISIFDPLTSRAAGSTWTRSVFPGNVIPASRMDPVAVKVIPFYPQANRPSDNAFQPLNNSFRAGTTLVDTSNLTLRADHSWSDSFRSYWRLNRSKYHIQPVLMLGTAAEYASDNIRPRYNGVWDNTLILNPTTTLNFRVNVTRWQYDLLPTTMNFNSDTLGFPAYLREQSSAEWTHFPSIGVAGVASLGGGGGLFWKSNSGNLAGSLTKVHGRHIIKTGMEYRKFFLNFFQPGNPNGGFSFSDNWTRNDPFRFSDTEGFGFASFLLGIPTSGSLRNVPRQALASSYWAGFVQDDIRVTSKLTLNVGLRYDIDTVRTERYNRMSFYDLSVPSPIAGKVPGLPNLVGAMRFMDENNRRQTPADKNNIAPRFGFAYQINPLTVVRGGYAILYDASPMQVANHNAGFQGYRLDSNMIVSIDGANPTAYLRNPFPDGFRQLNKGPDAELGFAIGDSWIPAYESPMIQQWNLNVQRSLPGNMVLEVGYIATKGNHIQNGDTTPYNQLDPQYLSLGNRLREQVANPFLGIITDPRTPLSAATVEYGQLLRPHPQLTGLDLLWRPYGNSIYHAMVMRFERRFSQGFGFLASLTAGKLISDSEASGFFTSGGQSAVQNTFDRRQERAVSNEDISRRFVFSSDYQLPFGKGRKFLADTNAVANAFLGGWQVNGLWTYQTGTPITVFQPANQAGIYNARQRPTSNGQPVTYTSGDTNARILRWFDPSSFSVTGPYAFGSAPRTLTSVRHPGVANVDASLFKVFTILPENRLNAQFRLEAFNVFNKAQFGRVNSTIASTSVGNITSVAVQPRQLQLGLKLIF